MKNNLTVEAILREKTELRNTIHKAIETFRSNTDLNPIVEIEMVGTATRNGELTIYGVKVEVAI